VSGDERAELERDYPGWHAWRGVGDTGWYARRELSSPPIVLRAESLDDLRKQVRDYVAERARPYTATRPADPGGRVGPARNASLPKLVAMPDHASRSQPARRIPVQSVCGPTPEATETLRLLFCLVEIERQAEIFSRSLDDALSEAIDKGNTTAAWRHIQSAMFAAIIVHRFVVIDQSPPAWPGYPSKSEGRKAALSAAEWRVSNLRNLLFPGDVTNPKTWIDRVSKFRNSLEHVDERFDLAFNTESAASLSDWYLFDDFFLFPPEETPKGTDMAGLRGFNPEEGFLLFNREPLDLFELDIEMTNIRHNSRYSQAELLRNLKGRMTFGGGRIVRPEFPADRMTKWRNQRAQLEAEMAPVVHLEGQVRMYMQLEDGDQSPGNAVSDQET
jgi:hypothetical protein